MEKIIKTIETERLILRGIDEADAESIVKWRSVPDVFRYFLSPHQITLEEHMNWYQNRYLSNEKRFDWMCFDKQTGIRIGVFGLYKDDGFAEVNYLLAPEAQHKGFATEAVKELMRFASDEWGYKRFIAEIHEENEASVKLAEKLGFRVESCNPPFNVYQLEI